MARLLGITFAAIFGMMLVAHRFIGGGGAPVAVATAEAGGTFSASSAPAAPDPWARHDYGSRPGDEVRLSRDGSGQFHLTARVNGRDAQFLVDTGADVVAISEREARNLGLNVGSDQFRPIMRTASGTGYGAMVRLDRIEVAGRALHNVDAVVMQGLSTNLLGQSALRQLGKVELQGDTMVIHPG